MTDEVSIGQDGPSTRQMKEDPKARPLGRWEVPTNRGWSTKQGKSLGGELLTDKMWERPIT